MTTITLPRAVVEQALEALTPWMDSDHTVQHAAYHALRTALAQQAEPVEPITRLFGTLPVHDAQQAEPVQEPVAWRDSDNSDPGQGCTYDKAKAARWPHIYKQPLYTAPPQQAEPVEPVAEPVAAERERCAEYLMQQAAECREDSPTRVTLESCAAVLRLGLHAQAEPVEPVAWLYTGIKQDGTEHGPHLVWKPEYMDAMSASKGAKAMPLYTAPPQRKPLMEGVFMGVYIDFDRAADPAWSKAEYLLHFARAVERAVERARGITDPQVEDRLARHGIPMPGDPK